MPSSSNHYEATARPSGVNTEIKLWPCEMFPPTETIASSFAGSPEEKLRSPSPSPRERTKCWKTAILTVISRRIIGVVPLFYYGSFSSSATKVYGVLLILFHIFRNWKIEYYKYISLECSNPKIRHFWNKRLKKWFLKVSTYNRISFCFIQALILLLSLFIVGIMHCLDHIYL